MSFSAIDEFENLISDFFNAPYAVATDCCTHAIELCLRYENYTELTIPTRTYVSIPMTAMKLGLNWSWNDDEWQEYYYLGNTNIIDAAFLWRENSYIPQTYMCISFQFRKHLSLGRGGIILLDNYDSYRVLKKMVYDGRTSDKPWFEQDIDIMGYHYYMTPEIASMGIEKFKEVAYIKPKKKYGFNDYPYLPDMRVFKNK